MAYMIMLILSSPSDLDDVLDAWREVGVRNATFIESSCSSEGECRPRHHIPIRFAFENLDPSTERCSCTLFAIAQDKATVQECISRVEAVVGDLDEVSGTALVAWPLPIAKGIPSLFQTLAGCRREKFFCKNASLRLVIWPATHRRE